MKIVLELFRMSLIKFQIVDIVSAIYPNDTTDLDNLTEDENDSKTALYQVKYQKILSFRNPTVIKLFGRTECDRAIVANVLGFQTFFYLGFVDLAKLTIDQMDYLMNYFKRQYNKRYQKQLIGWELLYKQPYDRFVGDDVFPYIKISFANHYALKAFEYLVAKHRKVSLSLGGPEVELFMCETNVDEILKFLHQTKLKPASWVGIRQARETIPKSSYCQFELDCQIAHLQPIDEIKNAPFKLMVYDLECQSQYGELGEFPMAHKNYQTLAKELIDLTVSHKSHPLIRDPLKFPRVLETCLVLAFTPYYYPVSIQQLITVDGLKPTPVLISKLVNFVINLRIGCTFNCSDCQQLLSSYLDESFPPLINGETYFQFSRELWLNLDNLIKAKYNDTLPAYLTEIIKTAFEDYYDRFGITGGYTTPRVSVESTSLGFARTNEDNQMAAIRRPNREKLSSLTTEIMEWLNLSDYDQKLEGLTKFLNQKLIDFPVKGDPIIQIGFTFQKLGQKNPYLKGIFTLDSCQNFTNKDLIFDENQATLNETELRLSLDKFNEIRIKNDADWSVLTNASELLTYQQFHQSKTDQADVLIRSYSNEKSLIQGFAEFVNGEDPDFVTGYNNHGFDDKYLHGRAQQLFISDTVNSLFSRLKSDQCSLLEQGAKRENDADNKGKKKIETHYLDMKGRVPFDINRIIPKDYTLPSYKLNDVCRYFFKKNKNDVPPTQIPVLQRGTASDRALIARYCIIDCVLCNRLLEHLCMIPNLIAMSNVTYVPIRYLIFRGQTVKGFSLVAKKCLERDKIIRTVKVDDSLMDEEKYEGAIVLEPLIDLYGENDPVAVADFNSLYPCSMQSENISNDTLVSDAKYDNLPNYHYNTISYDQFTYEQAKHKITGVTLKKKNKVKMDQMRVCRFAFSTNGKMGILPEIERELIANRKMAKRKMAEYEGIDSALESSWNCQQLAYKITCNSIYGITGASVSPIYNRDVAASITATGRKMIIFSKNYVENNYINVPFRLQKAKLSQGQSDILIKKAVCVYGDSVAAWTPIWIRKNGRVQLLEIGQLVNCQQFLRCADGKEVCPMDSDNLIQIWSDGGWTNLRHIVRHLINKPMYRIITSDSLIDVTADHSLLDVHANPIQPEHCLNKKLLTQTFPQLSSKSYSQFIEPDLAWVLGFGTATECDELSWKLISRNREYLEKSQKILRDHYQELDWEIESCVGGFQLIPTTIHIDRLIAFSQNWRKMCCMGIVPEVVMLSNRTIRIEYLRGYLNGQEPSQKLSNLHSNKWPKKLAFVTQLSAQSFSCLLHSLDFSVQLTVHPGKMDSYQLKFGAHSTCSVQSQPESGWVKQVIKLPPSDLPDPVNEKNYVYDLETDNHHFAAGIGRLVVHNTDSIFIKFEMVDAESGQKLTGSDAIYASMEVCAQVAKEISLQLKTPQNLEFEKTICPFLLINKKMYMGHYYEKINNPKYSIKTMGFATKKRDSAPIAKKVVDGLTTLLFQSTKQLTVAMVRDYLQTEFEKIIRGEYPIELFIRSKTWKGHYKAPDQIAQHVLAKRQATRDPGNQFQVNDRIAFVHIVKPKARLQGEKIETVDYMKKAGLKLDYEYYITNLLLNPLLKILSPNQNLQITEKWILQILKNITESQFHYKTDWGRLIIKNGDS